MPGIEPFLDLERHISRASYARTAQIVAGVHVARDGASGRGSGWVALDQQLLAEVVGQAGSRLRAATSQRIGPRASASIRHHSSSQLPPVRETQRWTVGDRE